MEGLIDTHTHLYLDDFNSDRQAVLQRARDAGVSRLLLPAVDSSSFSALQNMVLANPGLCFGMAGLHPTSVNADYQRELSCVEKALSGSSMPFIAVGEIGLDLYWDTTFLAQQEDALRHQLLLAEQYDLPVVLHLRGAKKDSAIDNHPASPDVYELFFEIWDDLHPGQQPSAHRSPGVMHCFSGSVEQAMRAIALGFFIGIGGVVTYKNAALQQVASAVPLERILLETDAPYLAPTPYRGHRNESAYIVEVAKKISDLKGITLEKVVRQTTFNAESLFRLPVE